MKTLRPLLFLVSLLLMVGLACKGGASTPTQPPQPPAVDTPTKAPVVTEAPTATEAPVATEAPTEVQAGSEFFTEEFDQDPGSNWSVDIIGPGAEDHKDSVKTEFSGSKMRIELPEKDLYFYYSFLGYSYKDVQIDLRADNRGVNTNNVSLFCRSSKDGWYEWSVGSGGDWYLYAVTDKYNLMAKGGTTYLKQGKEVNEYRLVCKGESISMFVNNKEVKQSPFKDKKYGLRDGGVGFNVSSLNVTPVIVEVDWFKISQPE